jgi:hypothetical protein
MIGARLLSAKLTGARLIVARLIDARLIARLTGDRLLDCARLCVIYTLDQ